MVVGLLCKLLLLADTSNHASKRTAPTKRVFDDAALTKSKFGQRFCRFCSARAPDCRAFACGRVKRRRQARYPKARRQGWRGSKKFPCATATDVCSRDLQNQWKDICRKNSPKALGSRSDFFRQRLRLKDSKSPLAPFSGLRARSVGRALPIALVLLVTFE